MADDKKGRNKQAANRERRQRERELREARERGDEVEPELDEAHELGDFDDVLENHEYPTTTDELIAAFGDREVETQRGSTTIEDVLDPIENETYDSPEDVRVRIQGLLHRG